MNSLIGVSLVVCYLVSRANSDFYWAELTLATPSILPPQVPLEGYAKNVKEFSKELFQRYDAAARGVITEWLQDEGWAVRDNPDKYGIDLIAEKDGVTWLVEVEIRTAWNGKFPFNTLQLSTRKKKFITPQTLFVVVSNDLEHFYAVTGDVFDLVGFVEKDTRLTKKELFYDIPLKFCHLYAIKNPPS